MSKELCILCLVFGVWLITDQLRDARSIRAVILGLILILLGVVNLCVRTFA